MTKKEKKPDYFQWTDAEKRRLKKLTKERLDRGVDPKPAERHSIVDLLIERQKARKKKPKKKKPKKSSLIARET